MGLKPIPPSQTAIGRKDLATQVRKTNWRYLCLRRREPPAFVSVKCPQPANLTGCLSMVGLGNSLSGQVENAPSASMAEAMLHIARIVFMPTKRDLSEQEALSLAAISGWQFRFWQRSHNCQNRGIVAQRICGSSRHTNNKCSTSPKQGVDRLPCWIVGRATRHGLDNRQRWQIHH